MMSVFTDREQWIDLPRKDSVSTANAATAAISGNQALPPVLGRLLSGTFWLALRVPLQVVFSLWTTRLILEAIGPVENGAYRFAWGFGFFQFLFEFGASSALQRQISDAWTRGDRDGRRPGYRVRVELLHGDGDLANRRASGRGLLGAAAHDASGQLVPPGGEASVAPGRDGALLRYSRSWSRACSRRPVATTSCRGTSWRSRCSDSWCWSWA